MLLTCDTFLIFLTTNLETQVIRNFPQSHKIRINNILLYKAWSLISVSFKSNCERAAYLAHEGRGHWMITVYLHSNFSPKQNCLSTVTHQDTLQDRWGVRQELCIRTFKTVIFCFQMTCGRGIFPACFYKGIIHYITNYCTSTQLMEPKGLPEVWMNQKLNRLSSKLRGSLNASQTLQANQKILFELASSIKYQSLN